MVFEKRPTGKQRRARELFALEIIYADRVYSVVVLFVNLSCRE